MQYGLGAIPSPKDERDYQLSELIASASSFPDEYINPIARTVNVFNQGGTSMCVACSLSALRWFTEYNQSNNRRIFSPAYIYGNRDGFGFMGEGMVVREALSSLKKNGTCFYDDFEGFYDTNTAVNLYHSRKKDLDPKAKPFRVSSYYAVSTIADIKTAVQKLGGVLISVPVYRDLYYPNSKGEVLKHTGTIYGYHAMVIVGWNKKNQWIVLNSWGDTYGDNGFCYLPYDYPISEAWAIVDNVTEVFYKMAQFIDTKNHWAEKSIDKAANKGVVSGFQDGSFHPDEGVTRG